MGAGVFTLQELVEDGDPSMVGVAGVRFEWTAGGAPTETFNAFGPNGFPVGGGARACPVKPWTIGGTQRTIRTNYPNAKRPGIQVLGYVLKQQTFRGRLDDRYNGAGYAIAVKNALEEMIERGNRVRISYDALSYEGLIIDHDFDVERVWDIGYTLVFDAHNKSTNGSSDLKRIVDSPTDPLTALNAHDTAVQATLDADDVAPRNAIKGTLSDDVTSSLVNMVDIRDQLAATIDARDVLPPEMPVDGFNRIATQFRAANAAAYNLALRLRSVRADTDMVHQSPLDTLNFEDWTRSMRYNARVVMGTATLGDEAASQRAESDAVRLYRPHAGEHLYAVSRRFYGTPHAWRLIYERNSLRSVVMSGEELLLIPARGGG